MQNLQFTFTRKQRQVLIGLGTILCLTALYQLVQNVLFMQTPYNFAESDSRFQSAWSSIISGKDSVGKVPDTLVIPADPASERPPKRLVAETGKSALVLINEATPAELTTLPGIGPALAARIVEYRNTYGKFRHVNELTEVRGIGAKKFAKIKDRVAVAAGTNGPTTRRE